MIASYCRTRLLMGLALGCVLSLFSLPSRGEGALATEFDAANLLYEKGQYEQAAHAYEAMLAKGVRSSSLLFNAGDAQFKSGQIGRAVAHWLEAQAIDPRNDRIQINLDFARKSINGGMLPVPTWPAQLRFLTLNEWAVLLLLTGWLFFGSLALVAWKPKWSARLRLPVVLSGVLLLTTLVLLTITARDRESSVVAVVIVEESVVRFGPLAESQSAYVAHNGAEFRVTDHKDAWLRVEDDLGHEGWLPDDQVIQLRAGRVFHGSAKPGESATARMAEADRLRP